jgi:hypothetical protein
VLQFCPHVAPPVSPTKKPNPSYRTRRRRRGRTGEKAAEEEKEGGVPERRLPMEEIAGGGGEVVVPPSPSPTRSREIAASSPHRLGPSFCGPIQRFTRTVTYRSGNIVLNVRLMSVGLVVHYHAGFYHALVQTASGAEVSVSMPPRPGCLTGS